MKTITMTEMAVVFGRLYGEALAGYVEMDVRMGALELLDAQLRSYGLELEVADAGHADFAKYVKVVEAEDDRYFGGR